MLVEQERQAYVHTSASGQAQLYSTANTSHTPRLQDTLPLLALSSEFSLTGWLVLVGWGEGTLIGTTRPPGSKVTTIYETSLDGFDVTSEFPVIR